MNCEEVEEQTEKTFHSAKLCVTSISLTEHMGTDVDWQTRKFSEKVTQIQEPGTAICLPRDLNGLISA